ncbi:MAG: hypothetical protein KDA66_01745 [Planctomycetaceae bacterium]|nr:hypothetical protein [Planctomycetaceae bacterium]
MSTNPSSSNPTDPQLTVQVGKDVCPSPHSFSNKVGRVLWAIVYVVLFRPSPRPLHFWRRLLLSLFGAKVGNNARIDPSVRIWAPWNLELGDESALGHNVDCYNVASIRIGQHATVSQYAFLCSATHDISDPHMRLISRPIHIDNQAWVCARAFIAPGVHVATGAVVGAQAVVTRDVEEWTVVAGNPAREIKKRVLRNPSAGANE